MATNLKNFDSLGGFSVGETTHIDENHNAMSLNTIEMKNLNFTDSKTTNYILRGLNTATLQLDNVGTQITIESNTVNFITGQATDRLPEEKKSKSKENEKHKGKKVKRTIVDYVNNSTDTTVDFMVTISIDFIKSLEDIGVEHDELKASAEYDPKLEEAINTVFEDEEVDEDGYSEEE